MMLTRFARRLPALAAGLCLLVAAGGAAAQVPPVDQVQIYKKAIAAIDGAEKKLAANDTTAAKALVKEANALFAKLQQNMPEQMKNLKLTPQQEEQWLQNNKLGDDSTAQGKNLERSGQAKLQESEALEAKGEKDLATKLQQESLRELQLAEKAHLKAAIYHLRNLQLSFSSLDK